MNVSTGLASHGGSFHLILLLLLHHLLPFLLLLLLLLPLLFWCVGVEYSARPQRHEANIRPNLINHHHQCHQDENEMFNGMLLFISANALQ